MFGGIEAGGTKFVCAVGTGPEEIVEEVRFPTTSPGETLDQAIAFFKKFDDLQAIGVGSFGPVDPDPASPTYGYVTTTPKPGWTNTNVLGALREVFDVPFGFDLDVNAAVLGEATWGAGQGIDHLIYVTIGTGIGAGVIINGQLLHGMIHPEMGHIRIPHERLRDTFDGVCPYHRDCFEGLASGTAINARWNCRAETLPDYHAAWELEAEYIALALQSYICTLSPQRIILGGGVMDQRHLFPRIHKRVRELLNGYIHSPKILEHIDEYIVPPALDNKAGVLGAIALAKRAIV